MARALPKQVRRIAPVRRWRHAQNERLPRSSSPLAALDSDVVELVRDFGKSKRLIAAVCHGPQLLIEAELVEGREMTSWPSVRKDLENAGAKWVDAQVCVDDNLITSRKPEDLEAFSRAVIERLG